MIQTRTIRIFISSTFKDMHSERDYLVKYTFPELRERCLKKGINLIDVDLRWGVTEKEAEEGKALEICLEEIENCRPFFIGILGERYGWAPDKYLVPAHEKFHWLNKFEKGHSITALEIYQGVLKNAEMQPRAFFYFRDPSFIKDVPQFKRHEVESESPESSKKLFHLKENIKDVYTLNKIKGNITESYKCRYNGIKINWAQVKSAKGIGLSDIDKEVLDKMDGDNNIIENDKLNLLNDAQKRIVEQFGVVYLKDLEDFGNKVRDDIWRVISEEFPEDTLIKDPLTNEINQHELFAKKRTQHFIGRNEIIQNITNLLNNQQITAPLFICGDPGSGKTALMAKIARDIPTKDNFLLIQRYCGVTPNSTDLDLLLKSILEQLSVYLNLPFNSDEAENAVKLANWLQEMILKVPSDNKVFIFIDAVDQLSSFNFSQQLKWLPAKLSPNVHFIFSAINAEAATHAREANILEIKIPPLTLDEQIEIVNTLLWEFRKKLGFDSHEQVNQMELLLQKEATQNPLYLVAACEELRIFPRFEEITARIRQLPDKLSDLMEQIVERMEEDHSKEIVSKALTFIDSSLYGLDEIELLKLLRSHNEPFLPQNTWTRISRSISTFLTNPFSEDNGLIRIFHHQFSIAIQKRYLQHTDQLKSVYSKLGNLGFENINNISKPLYNTELYTGIYYYKSDRISDLRNLLKIICNYDYDIFDARQEIFDNLIDYVIRTEAFSSENPFVQIIEDANFLHWEPFLNKLINKADFFQSQISWPWAQWLYELIIKEIDSLDINEDDESFRWYMNIKARALANYSQLLGRLNKSEKAISYLQQAISIREALLKTEGEGQESLENSMAGNYVGLSTQLKNNGQTAEALEILEKGIALFAKKIEMQKVDVFVLEGYIKAQSNHISLLSSQNRTKDIISNFKRTEEKIARLMSSYGQNTRIIEGYGALLNNYCIFLMEIKEDASSTKKYLNKAIDVYRQLLQLNPDDRKVKLAIATLHSNIGMLQSAQGELLEAEQSLKSVLDTIKKLYVETPELIPLKEGMFKSNMNLTSFYFNQGNNEDGAIYLNRAFLYSRELHQMNQDNNRYRKWFLNSSKTIAEYYINKNVKPKRIAEMLRTFILLELSPHWLFIYFNIAQDNDEIIEHNDTLELALDVYEKHPNSLTVNFIVSYIYVIRDQYNDGLPYAIKAKTLEPEKDIHPEMMDLVNQGLLDKILNKIKDNLSYPDDETTCNQKKLVLSLISKSAKQNFLLQSLKQNIEENPEKIQAYLKLANFYQNNGQIIKAEIILLKAIKKDENNEEANYQLGSIYSKQNKLKNAVVHFQTACNSNPQSTENLLALAFCFDNLKKFNLSTELYKKILTIDPLNYKALLELADIYLFVNRQYKESRKIYDKAFKNFPDDELFPFRIAQSYEKEDNDKKAEEWYLKALKIVPDDSETHTKLGKLYTQQENYENAAEHYSQALESDPDNAELVYSYADALYLTHDYENAAFYYNRKWELNPDDLDTVYWAGISYRKIEQYNKALEFFDAYSQGDPDNEYGHLVDCWYEKGLIFYNTNKTNEALLAFQQTINLDNNKANAYFYLSHVYCDLEDFDESLKAIAYACQIEPGDYYNLILHSIILKHLDRFDEAGEVLKKAIDLEPNIADAYFDYGNLLLELGSADKACSFLEKAVEIEPTEFEYKEKLMESLYLIENYEQVITLADEIISNDAKNINAIKHKGNSLSDLGEHEQSYKILINLERNGETDSLCKYSISTTLIERGDLAQAIEYLDQATELDDNFGAAYNNKAWCYKNLGQYDKAIEQADIAIQLEPEYPNPYFHKAESQYALGNKNDAIKTMKVAMQKGHPNAENTLKQW